MFFWIGIVLLSIRIPAWLWIDKPLHADEDADVRLVSICNFWNEISAFFWTFAHQLTYTRVYLVSDINKRKH